MKMTLPCSRSFTNDKAYVSITYQFLSCQMIGTFGALPPISAANGIA